MMCLTVVWGGGMILFPKSAVAWSFMMFFIVGTSFVGAILYGAQEEQKRIWDMEELEEANKMIESDDADINVDVDGQYQIYDKSTLEQKFKKFKNN